MGCIKRDVRTPCLRVLPISFGGAECPNRFTSAAMVIPPVITAAAAVAVAPLVALAVPVVALAVPVASVAKPQAA